jgi:GAF domain-containing protein
VTSSTGFDVARTFAQLAQDIASHDDVQGTRRHIVERARSSLNCAAAAIWHLREDGRMVLDAGTDHAFLSVLAQLLAEHPDGPSWQALNNRRMTLCEDLTIERHWPDYVETVLAETPVRSALAYPLAIDNEHLGVLSLYSERPGYFTHQLIDMGSIFAAHAAIALEKAYKSERADNLATALASNRRIGMAVGILMAAHKITDEQGFDLLRIASQNRHVKLRHIAEEVVLTGAVPDWDLRPRRPTPT